MYIQPIGTVSLENFNRHLFYIPVAHPIPFPVLFVSIFIVCLLPNEGKLHVGKIIFPTALNSAWKTVGSQQTHVE